MITHLTGELTHKSPISIVIDVRGVGYDVKISLSTFSVIKELTTCTLFTYQYIKGDVHALYGFATTEERGWFLRLIHINHVGPRTALTILSSLSPPELDQVIANNAVSALEAVKGIGAKVASRIVLELRHKLGQGSTIVKGKLITRHTDAITQEALIALTRLGLTQSVAEKSLAKVYEESTNDVPLTLEVLIKKALQVR